MWHITAADSERDQRRAAAALGALGITEGDRVVLALPNSPGLLAVVLGAARTGIVPVPLNPSLLPAELDLLIADADPQLTVRDESSLTALLDGPAEAELAPVPMCRPMHYTSGTSGMPKGVWSGVWSSSQALAAHVDEAAVWDLGPDDTHLTCSHLFLDGRRDDLIISGGVNVYPAEVEHALHDVPGIEEIAVFGVTDEQWGQRVCAAVIGDVSADAVLDRARAALAGYKRPKDVYLVGDLPRTGTGKLQRGRVADQLGLEEHPR